MNKPIRILGIAGSLRKGSYNRAALRAAVELAPEGVTVEIYESLAELPPFNADQDKDPPAVVRDLKARIRAADAVLLVTPEYNHSIPGVLKNAIDWASRPPDDNAWQDKPVAGMGCSTGMVGTARAQTHLRECFVFLNVRCVSRPEVLISNAAQRFDKDGRLTDEHSRQKIGELLKAIADAVKRP